VPWITQLDQTERSTLIATFSGWMLDGLDVMVYSFVLPTLIALWHLSKGQAGLLGTSALLTSSLGGWLAGLAADRYGRVRILQLTIAWFAVFTFLSGFTHSFTELLITRSLQGLGFGGEWAVGAVLIGENIRPAFRGRAVGTTQGGWSIGWAMAAICYTIAFKFLPPDIAWRSLFFIGILPALLALWIRHHVREPELFIQTRRSRSTTSIFAPSLLRTTALTTLVALGAQAAYHAVNTFLPLYLNQRGLGIVGTGAYLIVIIAGAFTGYLVSAHLADFLGRRAAMLLFAAGAFLAIGAYTLLPLGNPVILCLGFLVGFFPAGSFAPMRSIFTELFPTSVRASGQGFAYNVGRGLAAFSPALVGVFSARLSLGGAIAVFALSAYLLMAVAILLLPETRGRDLALIDAQINAQIDRETPSVPEP